jgi:hypothetical protein
MHRHLTLSTCPSVTDRKKPDQSRQRSGYFYSSEVFRIG